MAMIVVTFDGVGDWEFVQMANDPNTYPNISKLKGQALYRGDLKTIFVSNTYPIHTTISTGKLPKEHGVVSNFVKVDGKRRWAQLAEYIKSETIWDAAGKKGLTTAAILWPVTCGADIRWNLPEVHVHGGENQITEGLRHGSRLFQIKALLRHGGKFLGRSPPSLDAFSTAVACDVIRKKRPDLTLLHLLAYDMISHRVGSQSELLDIARKSLDDSLGRILEVAGADTTVLVFADHAHLDVSETVNLESILGESLFEQCGGSAFLAGPVEGIETRPWFGRFLTEQEMEESGYASRATCGIAAKPGYCFAAERQYRSNHGYPPDYEKYRVFYAVRGKNFPPDGEIVSDFGDVRDVTAIISKELGLNMI